MDIRDELHIGKPLEPGQELALAVLLTREYVTRLVDERLLRPEGITDQQYNVLRILMGGPAEGYLIREIRGRMIFRSADVPRLVDRLAAQGLVQRREDAADRRGSRVSLTAKGSALAAKLRDPSRRLDAVIESMLSSEDRTALIGLLERLRDGIREALGD